MDMLGPLLDKKAMDMLSPVLDKKAMDMLIPLLPKEAVGMLSPFLTPVFQLTKNVMQEDEVYEILQADLRPINNLLLDIATLFPNQRKEDWEVLKIWFQLLHNYLTQAINILHRYGPSQRQRRLDCVNCRPGRLFKRVKEWKLESDYIFQGLQSDFSMFVTSPTQIINTDPTPALSAEPLCEDEAWMVFERIAFREKGAPVDIKGCARNIAEECKGFPLAIRLVAAAMRGKTTVDEWNISLSSIKNQGQQPSSSYPQPTLHPQVYPLLRWCYDALPNSHIKNCFLYCAMYPKGCIYVQELVRMWIGEGFVRSKQKKHSMDMAIGWKYLNLLLDRCFFQNASDPKGSLLSHLLLRELQCIRVEDDIYEMAIYIGEKEENCLFKAGRGLQNFPTIHNHADCKRISLLDNGGIQNLPSELPCPKLVSLILSCDSIEEEVPSGFLVSLTSLKVLYLHGNWKSRTNSIPSSVGQLKQLEFLSLHGLPHIKELPEEICHLPFLQFLDISWCPSLESLPSKIGELQNLKYLNLSSCRMLKEIPHEISQLTSLTTLHLGYVGLSVQEDQLEARSIWRLKGFTNLRELTLSVDGKVAEGIMGTWLEMRHLDFTTPYLPRDMKEMRKLQSFELYDYKGSSLPDYTCNFRHLENIRLSRCDHLREVSPLEQLPNLKCLTLFDCSGLKELGIGSSGRASRFLMLQKLHLIGLEELEIIAGASSSNESVWNESTLPSLRILDIFNCPKLRRFPVGMDRLLNLSTIYGEQEWWDQIIWEDDAMKAHLQKLFRTRPY